MRKDVLMKLFVDLKNKKHFWQTEDKQTDVLRKFINSDAIIVLSNHENISYNRDFLPFVAEYLQKFPQFANLFSQNFLKSNEIIVQ